MPGWWKALFWLTIVFAGGYWLYFHWKTILLPARIAEYVVVHEIAHLHEPHHTPAFWMRVERAMPDYVQRRAWLAEHGIDVEGI
jgi:predicted metal-dependent hydrolase